MNVGINLDSNNKVIAVFDDTVNGDIRLDITDAIYKSIFEDKVPYKYEDEVLSVDTVKQQIDSLNTEIADLQSKLNDPLSVDKVTEAFEYKLRDESIPAELQQVLDDRQSWREQISTLQVELESLN